MTLLYLNTIKLASLRPLMLESKIATPSRHKYNKCLCIDCFPVKCLCWNITDKRARAVLVNLDHFCVASNGCDQKSYESYAVFLHAVNSNWSICCKSMQSCNHKGSEFSGLLAICVMTRPKTNIAMPNSLNALISRTMTPKKPKWSMTAEMMT